MSAFVVSPSEACSRLGQGDLALGRLDVRREVDGVEQGLCELDRLAAQGVTVLNRAAALLAAHDKLVTSVALGRAGIPHPTTVLFRIVGDRPPLPFPFVVKPRFGSWGRDVFLCRSDRDWQHTRAQIKKRPWFAMLGALAQDLVSPLGHDLRVVVAGGDVVGAVRRVAQPGEWRTNVALGARREPEEPTPAVCELAIAAADAVGTDLVGVDLLPTLSGGYVVLELNGAVDFGAAYAPGRDVFGCATDALVLRVRRLEPDELASALA